MQDSPTSDLLSSSIEEFSFPALQPERSVNDFTLDNVQIVLLEDRFFLLHRQNCFKMALILYGVYLASLGALLTGSTRTTGDSITVRVEPE